VFDGKSEYWFASAGAMGALPDEHPAISAIDTINIIKTVVDLSIAASKFFVVKGINRGVKILFLPIMSVSHNTILNNIEQPPKIRD